MNEILKNKHLRNNFFLVTILTIIILCFIWWLLYYYGTENEVIKIAKNLIERLGTGILITILIAIYIYSQIPKYEPYEGAKFLTPKQIKIYFKSVLKEKPTNWTYKGGLGTYLRKTILPTLLENTENCNKKTTIKAYIPNPNNSTLCNLISNHRKIGKKIWSACDVKLSLFATIVVCAIYETKSTSLEISLFLTEFYSTNKIDLTNNSGILTKDDNSYGLKFKKETSHYDLWDGEVNISDLQSSSIKFNNDDISKKLSSEYIFGEVEGNDIKKILKELNVTENLTNDEFKKVAELVNEQQN